MPPVELDKPPTAPIDTEPSLEDSVEFDDPAGTDGRGGLLRDSTGHVAYPGYVPPDVHSPTTPERDADDPAAGPPNKSHSAPSQPGIRPKQHKFLTDAPATTRDGRPHASSAPSAPAVKRAATNSSALHAAICDTWAANHADSTSDSSSDDEREDVPRTGTDRPRDSKRRRIPNRDKFGRFKITNDNYRTHGKVSKKDGRLNITVNDTSATGYLAKTLDAAIKKVIPTHGSPEDRTARPKSSRLPSDITTASVSPRPPKLNIVIMVIGSRGDAQPFLKIGKVLKEEYGHRVRIATHPAFREFVEKDSGLEFFSVGGDPSELMAFMVKNPGMIPKLETVKAGDISRRRAAMAEMFDGFWRACINATDNEKDEHNLRMMGDKNPFVADAIIANPPSFAHVHCAEALGIPLHMMFTFPYTPTQAFPHPLANIKNSNVDPGYTNFISYPLVEMMVWQGLGDLVNDFRIKTLDLEPVHTLWAPGSMYRLHVPFTYLWSPALVPKPEDWGSEIDISGFVFLDLASSFKPPQSLMDFIDAGEQPIYIGFGSIVVDDADQFTDMIFEAISRAGVRALVSKGWGGLGQDNVPENVYMLENTPHDWLFPKVKACVIHGGAGTTAIALKCGKPTMVVPFFGDQNFWGAMIARAKAGPEPIPYKQLNVENLTDGIKYCLTDEALEAVKKLAQSIDAEGDGAQNAVRAFHRHLTLAGRDSMRCAILPDQAAVWAVRKTSLKLSAMAADIAIGKGLVSARMLRPIRHKEWNDFEGPGEPVSGLAGSLIGTVGDFIGGVAGLPYRFAKTSNDHSQQRKRKKNKVKNKVAGTGSAKTPGTPGAPEPDPTDYFDDLQDGVEKSGRALARAPLDLSLALAQGFHNAPRLYGDTTVRPLTRVTGMKSGLKAARDGFVYGMYDGFTGIIILPVRGAKEDGIKGAIVGAGMGVLGFVLKDLAALFGPIAYTLLGVSKEISGGNKRLVKHLRRARHVQARRELAALSINEKKAVEEESARGWTVMCELADIIIEEKEKNSINRCLPHRKTGDEKKTQSLGPWGNGPAFESVDTAKSAIDAIRNGESIENVLGTGRKSLDERPLSKGTENEQLLSAGAEREPGRKVSEVDSERTLLPVSAPRDHDASRMMTDDPSTAG
ncbi:glycosyltransferase family 1 protein [Xylariaceae sp. FL1272]|nr:glycosyltransferase family 1 protein [Xylariaceae sp. FL1272]